MKKSVEDQMQGAARQAKGKIKQETGRITRNRNLQAKGMVEKNVGKAQRTFGASRKESRRRGVTVRLREGAVRRFSAASLTQIPPL